MFEDHLFDLFGLGIGDWMDENSIVAESVSWSERVILDDDQTGHRDSLEINYEEAEIAVNFLLLHGEGNLMIALDSAKIVEISVGFPKTLMQQLIEMASTPLTKHQFLSDKQIGELE